MVIGLLDRNGEEGNAVVGWPPVKSWRKKVICQHQGGRMVFDRTAEKESGGAGPIYVKVKMEGVAIARKINLKLYQSYQMLKNSLTAMFARCKWLYHKISSSKFPNKVWWVWSCSTHRQKMWRGLCTLHSYLPRQGGWLAACRRCSMEVSVIFYVWFMGKDQKKERKNKNRLAPIKLFGAFFLSVI